MINDFKYVYPSILIYQSACAQLFVFWEPNNFCKYYNSLATYGWKWELFTLLSDSWDPMDGSPTSSSVCGISQARVWVGCHVLSQGIFPTQRLNLYLLHCRQILYQLNYQGSLSLLTSNLVWLVYNSLICVSNKLVKGKKVYWVTASQDRHIRDQV